MQTPASPRVQSVIDETNAQMINNFINHLFHVREKHFNVGCKLRPLLECLFATIIMYHNEVVAQYGSLHVISKAVIRSARVFHVSDRVLEEWGSRIKGDWLMRNAKPSMNNADSRNLMDIIIAQNDANNKISLRQEQKLAQMYEEVKYLRKAVEKYEGMFRDIRQQIEDTPSKRKRVEVRCNRLKSYSLLLPQDSLNYSTQATRSDVEETAEVVHTQIESTPLQDKPVKELSKPGAEPFTITEMSNLKLHYILFCRFNYELTCDASWTMNTGKSSSQDRSRITGTIMPLMLKSCEPEDLLVLQSRKPDTTTVEYEVWRSELLRVSLKVEERVRINLEAEEKEFLPPRNEKRKRDMCINGVMDRLKKVNNARKARVPIAGSSIARHCSGAQSSAMSSSSSSSSVIAGPVRKTIDIKKKGSKSSGSKVINSVDFFSARSK